MDTASNVVLNFIDERDAENRSRFQLFWQQYARENPAYLYFAAYAAVPALLTADMLYKIILNFSFPKNEEGQDLDVSYFAVSDLLQSSLCKPVSHRIFALYAPIRRALRQWLAEQPGLGDEHRKSLAQFALHYLDACPDEVWQPGLRAALRWDAQTITDTTYAGQVLLEAVIRSLRRQAPSYAVQKMVEAAEQNLPSPGRTTDVGRGLSRLAFAVSLYRGSQAYQSGHIDEAMKFFKDIYPQLEQRGGEEAFRVPIPEEILQRLKLQPQREKRDEQKDTYCYAFSLYVLLDEGVEAAQAARRMGVDLEQPGQLLPWSEQTVRLDIKGETWTVKFNVFFIHFISTPRLLDHLMFSRQGIYLFAVDAEKPEDLNAHIGVMLWRITPIAGPAPFHLWRAAGDWAGDFQGLEGTLRSQYPQLGAVVSDEEEVFAQVLGHLDETGIETGRYAERAWETWQECKPEPGTLQTVKEIDGRRQLAGGVFLEEDVIQKLAVAGEIFRISGIAGEPLIAANRPLFLSCLMEGFAHLEEKALEGSYSPEALISALAAGLSPDRTESLMGALEEYGLIFRKAGDQPRIVIPHLLPKKAPEFDINLYETAYQHTTLRFSGNRPAMLFNYFTALLGSSGASLRSCTRFGLVWETERETVRVLERPGLEWDVAQVRKDDKSEYGKQEPLYQLLDKTLAGYHGISYNPATPLQIPAFATPDMVQIAGGTFDMGDVMGDNEYNNEKPVHKVKLSSFYLGRYAVTFEEYDVFCEATNREKPKDAGWGRGRRPVIYVDWYDAVEYCNWLSGIWGLEKMYKIDKDRKDPNNKSNSDDKKWLVTINEDANGYRLPTEAEWEYAARAVFSPSGRGQGGGKVRFGNGKDIADPGEINFDGSESYKKPYSVVGEYRRKTVPVGSLNSPNALGLHDMSGNVYEWCWDWFAGDYYQSSPEDNPRGPGQGSYRVDRGGHWYSGPPYCRAAYRGSWPPAYRLNRVGFRLARSLEVGLSGSSYEPPVK